jgi:ABC-type Na+ efflux pump permease subunit
MSQLKFIIKTDLKANSRNKGFITMMLASILFLWGMLLSIAVIRVFISNETNNQGLIDPIQSIDFGLPIIISILSTFLVSNIYVASAIAKEKEKRTMEALISLPISRFKILLGKFISGLIFCSPMLFISIFFYLLYLFTLNEVLFTSRIDFYSIISLEVFFIFIFTLWLCLIINLGLGIAIASVANSEEASRQLFNMLILPLFLVLTLTLVSGSPEALSKTINSPIAYILYFLPWIHAVTILQKAFLPAYFIENNYLLNPFGEIWIDIIIHTGVIVVMTVSVLLLVSKFFEREGLIK